MSGALAAEAPASTDATSHRRWSREAGRLDSFVVITAVLLAVWTLWATAVPILTFSALGFLTVFWPITGVVWAIAAMRDAGSDTSRFLFVMLAVAAGLNFGGVLAFFMTFMGGLMPLAIAFAVAIAVFVLALLLEARRRLVWLAAPAIVVATIGFAISGVPAAARFAAAEPELTTYANALLNGGPQAYPGEWADTNLSIASYQVLATRVDNGCAHLATAWVGFDSVPAGLAYCPSDVPRGGRFGSGYQPFSGRWFLWSE